VVTHGSRIETNFNGGGYVAQWSYNAITEHTSDGHTVPHAHSLKEPGYLPPALPFHVPDDSSRGVIQKFYADLRDTSPRASAANDLESSSTRKVSIALITKTRI
jgi:hypothetical protein